MRRNLLALAFVLGLAAGPVAAQFSQYTAPGGPEERPIDARASLEEAVESARLRLGPLRLKPWLAIRDLGWIDNVNGAADAGLEPIEDDLRTTIGAGLQAYLPLGSKVTWAAHALPEYVYYVDNDELNRLNGRYGVALFSYFNRLGLTLEATRSESDGLVTPELPRRINSRTDRLGAELKIEISGGLSLTAAGSVSDFDNTLDDASRDDVFRRLDREETVERVAVEFEGRAGWLLSAGVERSEVTFDDPTFDRSNSGTSPLVAVAFPGNKIFFAAEAVFRSLDPDGAGSRFVPLDETTGGFQLTVGNEGRLVPILYASRSLLYSLGDPFAYGLNDRLGISAVLRLGSRTKVRGFVEAGEIDFVAVRPGFERLDDVASAGLTLDLPLRRNARLVLGYAREQYDSSLPSQDRTIDRLQTTIRFGESSTSPWY